MGRQTVDFSNDSSGNSKSSMKFDAIEKRYQNAPSEHYGYTGGAVNLRPYGIAK